MEVLFPLLEEFAMIGKRPLVVGATTSVGGWETTRVSPFTFAIDAGIVTDVEMVDVPLAI